MSVSRRDLLIGGSALFAASCATPIRGADSTGNVHQGGGPPSDPDRLDRLLSAHADALPEVAGAGANHYPMAAEALTALGHEAAIPDAWRRGAAAYSGTLPRQAPITDEHEALGNYRRYGDWLDYFRIRLVHEDWPEVVAAWAERLAPGLSGALLHGLIRTGHAVRALRTRPTPARRDELAVGLAYWAAGYTVLPTMPADARWQLDLAELLRRLDHPWGDDRSDVSFDAVMTRLIETPSAPPLVPIAANAAAALEVVMREAVTAFEFMLMQEQQRLWLLHTVTGPAAVGLLLPHVRDEGAHALVAHARQAVVALHRAYGASFAPVAPSVTEPPPWSQLLLQAVHSHSVHTIKLLEALARFDAAENALYRRVAAQWLAWK